MSLGHIKARITMTTEILCSIFHSDFDSQRWNLTGHNTTLDKIARLLCRQTDHAALFIGYLLERGKNQQDVVRHSVSS